MNNIVLRHNKSLPETRPLLMGILNITPDSFSDGGKFQSINKALEHALLMENEGADIIDIGGESSRPGSEPVSEDEEIQRVIPVIKAIRDKSDIPISIDTYKAKTAELAIKEGADIINDISALRFDSQMGETAAQLGVPIILMHMQGTPRDMQKNPGYTDVIQEIIQFFEKQLRFAQICGISDSKIILDPGIGFGKRLKDNVDILSNLDKFKVLGKPLLVGASRKTFIENIHSPAKDSQNRIGGSIAAALVALEKGADIIRVHDVAQTKEALEVMKGLTS